MNEIVFVEMVIASPGMEKSWFASGIYTQASLNPASLTGLAAYPCKIGKFSQARG